DQRHHPRGALSYLPNSTDEEHCSAIEKDDGPESGENVRGSREHRSSEPKPLLDSLAPHKGQSSEQEGDPESVPEHLGCVTCVPIVGLSCGMCRASWTLALMNVA